MVHIKGGQTLPVTVAGRDYSLKFAAVISDERCPARVVCAWANPPVIALEASAPGHAAQHFELSTGNRKGAREISYQGASIKFVDLLPAPQEPAEFAKLKPLESYTAVLEIEEQ